MQVKQVKLSRQKLKVIAWIDSKLAKKKVLLEDDDSHRWIVEQVYKTTVDSSTLHQDWKVGGLV
jgi:hypothetical protein